MANERPIEFSKRVLDKRNTLTGPEKDKNGFPKSPKHVSIQNHEEQE